MRGATLKAEVEDVKVQISIHAPHAGCDYSQTDSRRIHLISIHAPHAGCDFQRQYPLRAMRISIHAPHAGCDVKTVAQVLTDEQFQSTHPMRGATASAAETVVAAYISIHAPLAGCDRHTRSCPMIFSSFQSTHPLRGATHSSGYCVTMRNISIHAPLAGCDVRVYGVLNKHIHFNPRTPCGVRLTTDPVPATCTEFQSTHPLRGATSAFLEATRSVKLFQSTHPLRGATMRAFRRAMKQEISIHAPLAGCDW